MDTNNMFNGEMFNLNMFSKKLSNEEIKEMARDMCSGVEETHGEVRVMKWEDVLLKTRTGNITEIDTRCKIVHLQVKLQQTEEKLNETLTELEQSKEETSTCNSELESKSQQLNETLGELAQTKEDKETYRRGLENKSQQLNATETEKETTIKELDTVTQELNITNTALNQTQVELKQVKDLLEKAKDCPLNTTISSYWDLLYSTEFFGAVITSHKLEVLTKSIEKLEYFEGTRITDGIIQFFKMFHDGEDQCLS
ncbi:kinesin-like protein KIF11 [Bolinopsis microptera]|uniref:kinesin-like protein KIF11 n=1 Tax=Bolinopsis microptera TaxID=2820187 RepID=UPI003079FB6B